MIHNSIAMPNSAINQVKQICRAYNINPSRQKGQNFLINPEIIEKIIQAADLKKSDTVLEVGPGLGILTEELVKRVKKVISVELDKKLFDFLKVKFAGVSNLELINADILRSPVTGHRLPVYKIVSNLPYNITSHFLRKFLTAKNRPAGMTLLIQKEVAQRICAPVGQMSLLALSVQFYGQPKIIDFVKRDNFWPTPEVDSAILTISKIKNQQAVDNYLAGVNEEFFWRVIKISFSAKRKQIHNNLAAGLHLPDEEIKKMLKKANFDPKIRAQNLSLADWLALVKSLSL